MLPNKTDREKLYIQLTDILLKKIHSGEWRTGRQIPTEEDLCKGFNVSKITVRRAINNLVIEGHLEKLQGKGTFVRQGPPKSGMSMKTTLVESVFLPSDDYHVRVLENKILTTLDEEVMRRMGPAIDRDIYYLARLQILEGVAVLVNEIYIPLKVCPELAGRDPEGGAVFEFLRENSGTKIAKVSQSIEVGKPGPLAQYLNTRSTSPCMVIHRTFTSPGETLVAYSKTTARGDRFQLDSEYVRLN